MFTHINQFKNKSSSLLGFLLSHAESSLLFADGKTADVVVQKCQ